MPHKYEKVIQFVERKALKLEEDWEREYQEIKLIREKENLELFQEFVLCCKACQEFALLDDSSSKFRDVLKHLKTENDLVKDNFESRDWSPEVVSWFDEWIDRDGPVKIMESMLSPDYFPPIDEEDLTFHLVVICLYNVLPYKFRPVIMDLRMDVARRRLLEVVTFLIVESDRAMTDLKRTKKSAIRRKSDKERRKKEVLDHYKMIKRKGKSLWTVAGMIQHKLSMSITQRTIYNYLLEEDEF